ncbi:MAG: hypothetical protein L0027_15210, partial [Candidatus Rokubacteria bacterium]|nr:hypothetical protein [Candidatus Rokubacteria bacterium]
ARGRGRSAPDGSVRSMSEAAGASASRRERFRLTEEGVKAVCDVLSRGGNQRQAEIAARMSRGHLTWLLKRGEEHSSAGRRTLKSRLFRTATRAREAAKKRLVDFVWEAATTGYEVTQTEVIEKAGVRTTRVTRTSFMKPELALEILARRWPEEWGRRSRGVSDDLPSHDSRDDEPADRERLLRHLSRKYAKYAPKRGGLSDGVIKPARSPSSNGDVVEVPEPPKRPSAAGPNGRA